MPSSLVRINTGLALILTAGLMAHSEVRAQIQEKQEYTPTAPSAKILQDDLAAFQGKEANFIVIDMPPGHVGGKHYHTSDVFVYVLNGTFAVDVEGKERQTFKAGEVYHEALNKVMQASNPSTTEPTKILVVQVANKGEPLMIKAE